MDFKNFQYDCDRSDPCNPADNLLSFQKIKWYCDKRANSDESGESFFTAADNQKDIVPVDWVADVISDKMAKKGYIDKILADTLETGWGAMIDCSSVAAQVAANKHSR